MIPAGDGVISAVTAAPARLDRREISARFGLSGHLPHRHYPLVSSVLGSDSFAASPGQVPPLQSGLPRTGGGPDLATLFAWGGLPPFGGIDHRRGDGPKRQKADRLTASRNRRSRISPRPARARHGGFDRPPHRSSARAEHACLCAPWPFLCRRAMHIIWPGGPGHEGEAVAGSPLPTTLC